MRPVSKQHSQAQKKNGRPKKKGKRESKALGSDGSSTSRLENCFVKRQISTKQHKKWSLLNLSTKAFVTTLIHSCMDNVLAEAEESERTEMQEALNELKQRVFNNLETQKAPVNKIDYSKLHQKQICQEKLRSKLTEEEEALNAAIQKTEGIIAKTREKITQLELEESSVKKTLFTDIEDKPDVEHMYVDYDSVELLKPKGRT
ncbi:uncharacterized protein LOC135476651 [Liolophura sinensis]|uniref:uncharacterized protein LOC135476651 n=1 Tax=Liolophura sinensis TaxID=3198878 RepID=UPI0031584F67